MAPSTTLVIVSGGQTGADRGALDAALHHGVTTGGWLPRGRLAEDGPLPMTYPAMRQTDSADPAVRTRANVLEADGTVVLHHGAATGGTALTLRLAREIGKPLLELDLSATQISTAATRLLAWRRRHQLRRINIAGPRASEDAQIYGAVYSVLDATLKAVAGGAGSHPAAAGTNGGDGPGQAGCSGA